MAKRKSGQRQAPNERQRRQQQQLEQDYKRISFGNTEFRVSRQGSKVVFESDSGDSYSRDIRDIQRDSRGRITGWFGDNPPDAKDGKGGEVDPSLADRVQKAIEEFDPNQDYQLGKGKTKEEGEDEDIRALIRESLDLFEEMRRQPKPDSESRQTLAGKGATYGEFRETSPVRKFIVNRIKDRRKKINGLTITKILKAPISQLNQELDAVQQLFLTRQSEYDPGIRNYIDQQSREFNSKENRWENKAETVVKIIDRAIEEEQIGYSQIYRQQGFQAGITYQDILDNLSPGQINEILSRQENLPIQIGDRMATTDLVRELHNKVKQEEKKQAKLIEDRIVNQFYQEQARRIKDREPLLERADLETLLSKHRLGGRKNESSYTSRSLREIEDLVIRESPKQQANFITVYRDLERKNFVDKPGDIDKLTNQINEKIGKKLKAETIKNAQITMGQDTLPENQIKVKTSEGDLPVYEVLKEALAQKADNEQYANKLEEIIGNPTESYSLSYGGKQVIIDGFDLEEAVQNQNFQEIYQFVGETVQGDEELSRAISQELMDSGLDTTQLTNNEKGILKLQLQKALLTEVSELQRLVQETTDKTLARVLLEESETEDLAVGNLLRVVTAGSLKEFDELDAQYKIQAYKEALKLSHFLESGDTEKEVEKENVNPLVSTFLKEETSPGVSLFERLESTIRSFYRIKDVLQGATDKISGDEDKAFKGIIKAFRVIAKSKEEFKQGRKIKDRTGRFPEQTQAVDNFWSNAVERGTELIQRYQRFNRTPGGRDIADRARENVAMMTYLVQEGVETDDLDITNTQQLKERFNSVKLKEKKWEEAKQLTGLKPMDFPDSYTYEQKQLLRQREAIAKQRVDRLYREMVGKLSEEEKRERLVKSNPLLDTDKSNQIANFTNRYFREKALSEIVSEGIGLSRKELTTAVNKRGKISDLEQEAVTRVLEAKERLMREAGIMDAEGAIDGQKMADFYTRKFGEFSEKVINQGTIFTKKIFKSKSEEVLEERIHLGMPEIFDQALLENLSDAELGYLHSQYLQSRVGNNPQKTNYKSRFTVLGLLRAGFSEDEVRALLRSKNSLNSENHHFEQFLVADLTGKGETSGAATIDHHAPGSEIKDNGIYANKATIKHEDLHWVEGRVNVSQLSDETPTSLERFTDQELDRIGDRLGKDLSKQSRLEKIKSVVKAKDTTDPNAVTRKISEEIEDLQTDIDLQTAELLYDSIASKPDRERTSLEHQVLSEDREEFIRKYMDNEGKLRLAINSDEKLVRDFVNENMEALAQMYKPLKQSIDSQVSLTVPRVSVHSKTSKDNQFDRKKGEYHNYNITGITLGQRVKIDGEGNLATDVDDSLLIAYEVHSKVPDALRDQVEIRNTFKEAQLAKPPEDRKIDEEYSPVTDKIPYTKQYFDAPYAIHQEQFYHALHFMSESTANSLEDNYDKVERLYTRLAYEARESVRKPIREDKARMKALRSEVSKEGFAKGSPEHAARVEEKIGEIAQEQEEKLIEKLNDKFGLKEGQISLTGVTQFGVGYQERKKHSSANETNQNRFQPYYQLRKIEEAISSRLEKKGAAPEDIYEVGRILSRYKITQDNHIAQSQQYAKQKAQNEPILSGINQSKKALGFEAYRLESLEDELGLFVSEKSEGLSPTNKDNRDRAVNSYLERTLGKKGKAVKTAIAKQLGIKPEAVTEEILLDAAIQADAKGVDSLARIGELDLKQGVSREQLREAYSQTRWGGKALDQVLAKYRQVTSDDRYQKREDELQALWEATNQEALRMDNFLVDNVDDNPRLSDQGKEEIRRWLQSEEGYNSLGDIDPLTTPDEAVKQLSRLVVERGGSFGIEGMRDEDVLSLIEEFQ